MGTPTASHRDAPAFAALIELCSERDLPEISIEELVERAGIERDEFDREFAGVDDCFDRLFDEEKLLLFSRIDAARAAEEDWRGRLRATAYTLMYYLCEDPRVTKMTVVDIRMASERVQLSWAEAFGRFVEYVDEGRAELPTDEQPSASLAQSVAGGIFNQLWGRIGTGGAAPSPEDVVPAMMYTAVLSYLGEDAAREELTLPPPRHLIP